MSCPFHNTRDIKEFDPIDERIRENPWPYYHWLKESEERRVYEIKNDKGFYVIHHYDDVKKVLLDDESFSSDIAPTIRKLTFNFDDGIQHQVLKSLFLDLFSTKAHPKLYDVIQEISLQASQDLDKEGEVDMMKEWASYLPLAVLCHLYELPTDKPFVSKLNQSVVSINKAFFILGGTGPRRSSKPTWREKFQIAGALLNNTGRLLRLMRLLGYGNFMELVKMFKLKASTGVLPRPSFSEIPQSIGPMIELLSLITVAFNKYRKVNGRGFLNKLYNNAKSNAITEIELVSNSFFIFLVGHETVASLLSSSLLHLAENPELMKRIKQQPDLLDDIIEEVARKYSPAGRFVRRVIKNVEIGGKNIPSGSIVLLLLGAANVDEAIFENPCMVDADRQNSRAHMAFGKGKHACIGAPMAKLQVKMAILQLLKDVGSITVNYGKSTKMVNDRDIGIYRHERLFVTFQKI
jgi:cytochrome P450